MERDFEERLKTLGMTRSTWAVLSAIHNGKAVTSLALAKFIGIHGSAITRHLDRLEDQKLIVRSTNRADRRSITLALTAKAKRLIPVVARHSKETNEKFSNGISPEEMENLRKTMSKMLVNGDTVPADI